MSLKERTYSVLIVSSAESFNMHTKTLLPAARYSPVHFAESVCSAERVILERAYDFVLINSPLPDDMGMKFAIDLCRGQNTVVLFFVKNALHAAAHDKVGEYGVFTLPKPTSSQMVVQALEWMESARERLRKTEKKTVSLEEKMKEIRIVNHAKWLLIDVLKMTEADAHRYIEKTAMDQCKSKREIAENIIRTYE